MTNEPIEFDLLTGPDLPTKSYKAGEIIFKEGEPASELFVIQQGSVAILLGNRRLDTLGPKAMFGEMAIVDGSPRSASAIAETAVTLVPVSEKQFIFLVGHTPYFALKVLRQLSRRLRTANTAV